MTCVWVYLAAWAVTTPITFAASRRLGERTATPLSVFFVSIVAGALWPVLLIGAAELSSLAAYSTAETWLVRPDPDNFGDAVIPLR
jgi:short subunit fatty acids transporter